MKTLLLLFTISLSLLAGTTYKTPPFTVEGKPLFCTDYYGDNITVQPIGQIISGDTAINYCSYDESAAKDKQLQMQKIHNKSYDDLGNTILNIILSIMGLALLGLIIVMSSV